MKQWAAVLRAADAAARWHAHQLGKGAAAEPYINHLLEVASPVAEATQGKDPNVVIAALLHDAIEDQDARQVVSGLRGASPWLEEQFERAADDAQHSIHAHGSPR